MPAYHQPLPERDLELLSAYLDGEISDRERAALEHRLDHEVALKRELDGLRQTVALLNDLPRLRTPRNFTLDPARYGRTMPWWRRLLPFENMLQLSGALGAVASVALIVLALVISGSTLTLGTDRGDSAVGESVAFQPTPSAIPTVTLPAGAPAETALAYAGEDLLQTTMAAQSTLYAVPPFAEDVVAPGVSSDASAAAQHIEEAPAPLAAAESEAAFDAFGIAPEGQIEAAASLDAGSGAANSASTGQSLREASESDSDGTAEVDIQTTAPTAPAVAQAPTQQDEQLSATKHGIATRDTRDNNTYAVILAAAGVILFTLSLGLLILGRKKDGQA